MVNPGTKPPGLLSSFPLDACFRVGIKNVRPVVPVNATLDSHVEIVCNIRLQIKLSNPTPGRRGRHPREFSMSLETVDDADTSTFVGPQPQKQPHRRAEADLFKHSLGWEV
jgi:hypothetical protein